MAEERVQRRLAAILAADVVGYSRLMGVDEAGTLARLKALRKDVIDPRIAEHGGRIVKLMGDGTLVEFLRYPPRQWKSLRTTNAVERLHGEFKRRIKSQCALPNAETAAMLFWALMASGQITMRRVDGW